MSGNSDTLQRVFLSYSSSDKTAMEELCAFLEGAGAAVWVAPRMDAGKDFRKEIRRHIELASAFVALISPNSLDSGECDDEFETVKGLDRVTQIRVLIDSSRELMERATDELPGKRLHVLRMDSDEFYPHLARSVAHALGVDALPGPTGGGELDAVEPFRVVDGVDGELVGVRGSGNSHLIITRSGDGLAMTRMDRPGEGGVPLYRGQVSSAALSADGRLVGVLANGRLRIATLIGELIPTPEQWATARLDPTMRPTRVLALRRDLDITVALVCDEESTTAVLIDSAGGCRDVRTLPGAARSAALIGNDEVVGVGDDHRWIANGPASIEPPLPDRSWECVDVADLGSTDLLVATATAARQRTAVAIDDRTQVRAGTIAGVVSSVSVVRAARQEPRAAAVAAKIGSQVALFRVADFGSVRA